MRSNGDLERGPNSKPRNQTYYAAGSAGGGAYHMEYSDTQWTSWLVPMIVVANVAMFVVIMLVNNCPKNNDGFQGRCVARFLGRLSFQPLKENPLFGPSSSTYDYFPLISLPLLMMIVLKISLLLLWVWLVN